MDSFIGPVNWRILFAELEEVLHTELLKNPHASTLVIPSLEDLSVRQVNYAVYLVSRREEMFGLCRNC
jgi:hypothetical protein